MITQERFDTIAKSLLARHTCYTCMFCGSIATVEYFDEIDDQRFFDISGIRKKEIRANSIIEGTIFACSIRNVRALPEELTCGIWVQAEE